MPARLLEPTPSAYTYPLLISQLLHAPLANAPEQEIVYRDRVRLTYRTLRHRIGRLASGLTLLGVAPGDTVAVMDWDSHRYLECYFAVPMMGAVLQTVNIRLSPTQIAYTMDHAGASTVLIHADFVGLFAAILPQLPRVQRIVLLQEDAAVESALPTPVTTPVTTATTYEAMLASASPDFTFPDLDENTVATTFYTTGTTGLPKGVAFSHRQIVLHTLGAGLALASPGAGQRFHRGDVYMPLTPMFHVHAWGLPYVATLHGVKQVYVGRYAPDVILALRREEGVTFSHCVPTILQMLLAHEAAKGERFDGWTMVIGGSALPLSLVRDAVARGIDVFSGYGMSETGPVLTLAQPGPEVDEASHVRRTQTGWSVPLVHLRTVDEAMQDVPRDGQGTGEVVVRAPWLTQAYVRQVGVTQGDASRESEALWRGGALHTGDIATIDASGCVRITDRLKDVIKSGGEWVSSLELEDLIGRLEGVADVAVIGVPDAKWGERPMALVVRRPSASLAEAEIRTHVESYVAQGLVSRYAVPERVLFVDALDRTSVGKTDKKALRERYAT
jgi:fatty-acyl-CoA synthase